MLLSTVPKQPVMWGPHEMTQTRKSPAGRPTGEALGTLKCLADNSDYTPFGHEFKDRLHHERQVARLHALGPRPLAEFLADIARSTGQPALIADHVAEYARLDPEIVRAIGADDFPPNVLGLVK